MEDASDVVGVGHEVEDTHALAGSPSGLPVKASHSSGLDSMPSIRSTHDARLAELDALTSHAVLKDSMTRFRSPGLGSIIG